MTLAAQLAQLLCEEIEPVPGVVHDPTQPLVLGDQGSNNYVVITWDALQKRTQIQSVSQAPGGPLLQAILTFSSSGQLLVNNQSIANLAEFQALLAATQQAAADAIAAAATATTQASVAANNAQGAADSADAAVDAATLSQQWAIAPEGSSLPGGGNSSAVSAALAQDIATESRDLDIGDNVSGNETFQSGFLFTERQYVGAGLGIVTIPAGIFSSPLKKARWASYRLRGTGSVKFVGAAGGTNLVAPQIIARGRSAYRLNTTGSGVRHTLAVPVTYPNLASAGEIIAVFHALHQGPSQTQVMNFSATGGLTWSTLSAYAANPGAVSWPNYFIVRAPIASLTGQSLTLSFDEGFFSHVQACDWWVLDGVDGVAPRFAIDGRTTVQSRNQATLTALAAQSRVLISAAQGATEADSGYSNISTNLTKAASGNTNGIDDVAVLDSNVMKNEVYGVGDGLATATADFTGFVSWASGAYRGNAVLIAYGPKTVIGGGDVIMNYEGGRDTLDVDNGVAELWFQNDGKTVDVRTPTP